MLLYVLLMGSLAVLRHRHFGSCAYDLGIYDQALWLLSQGYEPFCTVRDLHILGDHFTPILFPLALLYRVGNGTENLLWFQTLALAAGAWPLYRMGVRLAASEVVGVLAAVTYLTFPPLRSANLFDFHPIALATPGVLFALDYATQRRAGPFVAACLWTALCKQEATVMAAGLGLWYAIRWREPRALWLCAGTLIWFVLALKAQAHFAGAQESSYAELYSRYGENTGEILRTFLLTPWVPLVSMQWNEVIPYLLLLVAPLAFLPLRAPGILVLLAFPLVLNLFSNRGVMRGIDYQYNSLITPVLFAAAVVALARIPPGEARRFSLGAWAVCSLMIGLTFSSIWQRDLQRAGVTPEEAAGFNRVLATLPAEASVCATQNLVPHLSARRQIYMFPNPFWPLCTGPSRLALRQQLGMDHPFLDPASYHRRLAASQVDYLVLGHRLNRIYASFPFRQGGDLPYLAETLRNPAYGLVQDEAGIWVLKRGANHAAGLRRIGVPSEASQEQVLKRVRELLVQDAAKHPRPW
jgi:uncharacterized membrane protein